MEKLQDVLTYVKNLLQEKNVNQALLSIEESNTRELTYENGECSLLRTLFGQTVGINIIKNQKNGKSQINDFSKEALKTAVETALSSAEAGDADVAYAFAKNEEDLSICEGVLDSDMEKLLERVKELAHTIKKEYPKVQLIQLIASHSYTHRLVHNSNGGDADIRQGHYGISLEFAGNDNDKTAGLAGHFVAFESLDKPLIELDGVRTCLQSAVDELHLAELTDKFEGKVIFRPDCASQILAFAINCFASTQPVLSKTGPWIEKLDKQVASDNLTVKLAPMDERIFEKSLVTADGAWSKDYTIIDKGVLKQFDIGLYVSNKTGFKPAPNDGSGMIVEAGDTALNDMIKNVKRGLLVGSISAGRPSGNGELSGVAKNSFYIEDGEIVGAVNETMISMNLAELVHNIDAISREVWNTGSYCMPYLCFDGVNISGK
ncbi:PmbA protein [Lachnospiraceae bacterium XBB1006]|nr:PmbA protein [Lachnospiraceae bacterium XBB1006]